MVRSGAPCSDKLVAQLGRKWEIGETVSVNMPELDLAESELHPAKAVCMAGDTVPARHGIFDRPEGPVHVL